MIFWSKMQSENRNAFLAKTENCVLQATVLGVSTVYPIAKPIWNQFDELKFTKQYSCQIFFPNSIELYCVSCTIFVYY